MNLCKGRESVCAGLKLMLPALLVSTTGKSAASSEPAALEPSYLWQGLACDAFALGKDASALRKALCRIRIGALVSSVLEVVSGLQTEDFCRWSQRPGVQTTENQH